MDHYICTRGDTDFALVEVITYIHYLSATLKCATVEFLKVWVIFILWFSLFWIKIKLCIHVLCALGPICNIMTLASGSDNRRQGIKRTLISSCFWTQLITNVMEMCFIQNIMYIQVMRMFQPLKYWRFRTLLLPMSNPATKKILEDETTHCNIYPTPTRSDLDQLTDGFLKMTELYFNKVKRPNKQRVSLELKLLYNDWLWSIQWSEFYV